ncbi:MAG: response regulator [Clostridiales bacterium]|nr:response regulator [Clostridiales bacterium]
MLKVMLVDDKQTIVDGMEMLIDWEKHGYSVAAKVTNAADAIEIIKKEKIDVVITDIRMPKMSGIELIKCMEEISSATKYILLSAYSEFEYAKFAIDHHVSGYILKPVDEEELIALLQKVKTEIERNNEYQKQQIGAYIMSLLAGKKNNINELTEFRESNNLRYIVVREFYRDMINLNSSRNVTGGSLYAVISRCSDEICFISENISGEVELVVDFTHSDGNVRTYTENIKEHLEAAGLTNFVIFVGSKCDTIEDISISKKSSEILVDALFYEDTGKVFIYDDYKDVEYNKLISEHELIDSITEYLNMMNDVGLRKTVDLFHDEIVRMRIRPDFVKTYIGKIIVEIGSFISRNDVQDAVFIVYRWSKLEKHPMLTHNIVYMFLTGAVDEISKAFMRIKNKSASGVIGEITDYINKNYANAELSMQLIAKIYYLTPSYLGKVFKEKMGESFKDYVLRVRMEKAKEMLINTSYKVHHIANLVGYTDVNYFYTKFQKYEGISPTQYREKNNKIGIDE